MIDIASCATWNEWLRAVRAERGAPIRVIASEFKDPVISEELLRLVELGKRKFSAEEFSRWKAIFSIEEDFPGIPLASQMELDRRKVWRRVKPTKGEPTWNSWVKSLRNGRGLTLKRVVSLMGIPGFVETTMSDVERGFRKFKEAEYLQWAAIFDVCYPPYEIPFANELSEKARFAAKQNRRHVRDQPQETRESLAEKALKVLNNPHLTLSQVDTLVNRLREEAMGMLGL